MNGNTQYQQEYQLQENVLDNHSYTLWLINDNYNTFEYVIDALINLCGHNYEQAMQCAWITHTKGKCDVYYALLDEIKIIAEKMLDKGLTVKITR